MSYRILRVLRLRVLPVLLLLAAVLPARAQQAAPIYTDALGTDWWPGVWNCSSGGAPQYNLNQTGTVATGAKALEIRYTCTGGGAVGFDHRTQWWTTLFYITPGPGDALRFKFNPGPVVTDDAALRITLNIGGKGADKPIANYLPAQVQPNTWYDVSIPLLDLMTEPTKFYRVFFWNYSNNQPHYFLDDIAIEYAGQEAPPVFTRAQVTNIGTFNARFAWATDRAANYTFRYIPSAGGQTITHTFPGTATAQAYDLTGLSPRTGYNYEIEASIPASNPSNPPLVARHLGSFTTEDIERIPPVISDVQVTTTETEAVVTWTTDEPADSRVEYGTSGYGQAVASAALTTSHRVVISILSPNTTYRFRLRSADTWTNTAVYEPNPPATFTTKSGTSETAVKTIFDDARGQNWWETVWACGGGQPMYNLNNTNPVANGSKSIEVSHAACSNGWGAFGFDARTQWWTEWFWMYPNPGDALTFKFNPGPVVTDDPFLSITLDVGSNNNDQLVSKYLPATIQPNTWYTVTIPVHDLMKTPAKFARVYFFNKGAKNAHYFLDDIQLLWGQTQTPPVFTDVQITHVGPDSARVSWVTDKQSQYTFRYTKNGEVISETFPYFATGGERILRGLSPATAYPFEIEALAHGADVTKPGAIGNYTGTVTTLDADKTPPVFSNIAVEIFSTHAILTWTTDEGADSRIEYGILGLDQSASDTKNGLHHRLQVTGLAPATTYRYRVGGSDKWGNAGWSEIATFTTPDVPKAVLTVDANVYVRPFRDGIRGQALGNWAFYYNRPYPNDTPKLLELTRLIKPGFLRYAGGLVSNNMMWSRKNIQGYPSGMMDSDGDGNPDKWGMRSYLNPLVDGVETCGGATVAKPGAYKYMYQAEEMDRLAAFANYVKADVMIEVDVTTCDPAMWADMVKYVNVEKGYNFRYWELGNELDLDHVNGIADIPVGEDYVQIFKTYHDALKAMDPSIRISGPTTASHALDDNYFQPYEKYIDPLTADPEVQARQMLGTFTFHYYPLWRSYSSFPTYLDMMNYQHQIPRRSRNYVPTMMQGMRQVLDSRGFQNVPIAITEFNAIAADAETALTTNHAGALFMADMLGRLAYNGADEIAHWLLMDSPAESYYGMTAHNESSIMRDYSGNVTLDDKYTPMPVYYAYLMYAQFFGDKMVRTASSVEDKLSVWATTDSDDPGAIKLIITNLSSEAIQATVNLNGVSIRNARLYEMANPQWVASPDKEAIKLGTTINGLALDASTAQAILTSARALVEAGRVMDASGDSFVHIFPPYTATAVLINAPDVVIEDAPALQPPVLLTPVPGAATELRWQAAPSAHTYRVQIARNAAFDAPMVDKKNVTESSFKASLAAGTYYVRVQSAKLNETSVWSEPLAFTVGMSKRIPGMTATAEVSATLEGSAVVLTWQAAGGASAGFEVQVKQPEADWTAKAYVAAQGQAHTHRLDDLTPGPHTFRLKQIAFDGTETYSAEVELLVPMPTAMQLKPAFPNPFHTETAFTLTLAENQKLKVEVFNALGQRVAVLHDGEARAYTPLTFKVDGSNLPSGLYLARITGASFTEVQKLMLVK